jgi:hypothetical protein
MTKPVKEMVRIPKGTTDEVIAVRARNVIMPEYLLKRTAKQTHQKEKVS